MKRGPRAYQTSCFNPFLFHIPSLSRSGGSSLAGSPVGAFALLTAPGVDKTLPTHSRQFCCSLLPCLLQPRPQTAPASRGSAAGMGQDEGKERWMGGVVPAGRSHQQCSVPSSAALHPAALPDLPGGEHGPERRWVREVGTARGWGLCQDQERARTAPSPPRPLRRAPKPPQCPPCCETPTSSWLQVKLDICPLLKDSLVPA